MNLDGSLAVHGSFRGSLGSRPVSGLASGLADLADRLPTSKRSGCVIRRNSPTVAGAAPELF